MRKDDFWIISLVALVVIGFATRWVLPVAIAVILNSLLVLWQVGRRIRELRHGKGR